MALVLGDPAILCCCYCLRDSNASRLILGKVRGLLGAPVDWLVGWLCAQLAGTRLAGSCPAAVLARSRSDVDYYYYTEHITGFDCFFLFAGLVKTTIRTHK